MEDTKLEVCYEYFKCTEFDCIRRDDLSKNCWEIDDVQCKSHSPQFEKIKISLNSKLEACKLCVFYQKYN